VVEGSFDDGFDLLQRGAARSSGLRACTGSDLRSANVPATVDLLDLDAGAHLTAAPLWRNTGIGYGNRLSDDRFLAAIARCVGVLAMFWCKYPPASAAQRQLTVVAISSPEKTAKSCAGIHHTRAVVPRPRGSVHRVRHATGAGERAASPRQLDALLEKGARARLTRSQVIDCRRDRACNSRARTDDEWLPERLAIDSIWRDASAGEARRETLLLPRHTLGSARDRAHHGYVLLVGSDEQFTEGGLHVRQEAFERN